MRDDIMIMSHLNKPTAYLILSLTALATFSDGQEYQIARSTIDGGGVMRSTGGAFELSGTAGQPDAGVMTGGVFELTGGFWFSEAPADCNSDGTVNLLDYDDFEACLLGPDLPTAALCHCFDVNQTDTVDLLDFAIAQTTFTGP